MSFLKYFSARFLTQGKNGDLRRIGGGAGIPVVIIPRSRVSFDRIKLTGRGSKARRAAKLHASQKSPYENLRTRIVLDKSDPNKGVIWSWDGTLSKRSDDALFQPNSIPETLARMPMKDGVRLVKCLDGVEAQIWNDSALQASRWWPEEPSEQDWVFFLRSARQSTTPETLRCRHAVLVPWRQNMSPLDKDPENLYRSFSPATLAILMSIAFLSISSFQATRIIVNTVQTANIEAAYHENLQSNRPALTERRKAVAALAEIVKIADAEPPANAAAIIEAFLQELSTSDATVKRIAIFNDEFEALATPKQEIDQTDLVQRLEKYDLLNDVYLEVQGNGRGLVIRANTPALQREPS